MDLVNSKFDLASSEKHLDKLRNVTEPVVARGGRESWKTVQEGGVVRRHKSVTKYHAVVMDR